MAAYYNEFDPKTAAWLRELIKADLIAPGDVDDRPIQEVKPYDLLGYVQCHFFAGIGGWSYALRLAGWPDNEPVWTGSCPCQPFSGAGKGLGTKDPRHLWPSFWSLISKCSPSTVLGEQVTSKNALRWLDGVYTDMELLGYTLGSAALPSASVGAPVDGRRIFWVAASESPWRCRRSTLEAPQSTKSGRPSENFRIGSWPDGRGSKSALTVSEVCAPSYGLPESVGLLRGYGNAIVPQVAAEFIAAYLEAREDLHNGRLLTMADF